MLTFFPNLSNCKNSIVEFGIDIFFFNINNEQSKKNSTFFIKNYLPVQFGFLFSEKARGPSTKSSPLNKSKTESYFCSIAVSTLA